MPAKRGPRGYWRWYWYPYPVVAFTEAGVGTDLASTVPSEARISPRGLTYLSAVTRGLLDESWSDLAFTSWMLTSWTTTRPRQATMMTPSQRMRRPISRPPRRGAGG